MLKLFTPTVGKILYTLNLCRKEASETLYWLEMIQSANKTKLIDSLMDENQQILKIFISSVKTARDKNGK